MDPFSAQSQFSLRSHSQLPTDFSSGSRQNSEMSALSQVEESEQVIVANAFRAQVSPQNDTTGQETRRLSESHLGSTETIENDTNRNMVSTFRDRLLSRNYFLIRWDRDLEQVVAGLTHTALNDVYVAISQLWPALSKSDIDHAYSMLVSMQNQDPSMASRSFGYLLENRLTRLLQHLGCDLYRVCSVCEDLMSIYNKRMSKIADRFELHALVSRICSAGKKVVFMSRGGGRNSNRIHKSYFYCPVETKEQNQVYAPLKIPIYIHNISQSFGVANHGERLEIVGHASNDPDDQLLQVVMEDLSCKANDMVFMRYNAYQNANTTMDGILVVDINTGVAIFPTLYSADGTRYTVNSHTNLTHILAGEFVEDAS